MELLSPVGNIEALYAAIQNGADAVYLGGKLFNARQYASNFDMEDLKIAVEYAHLRGVKVYVTVNILFSDKEIEKAVDYIKYLYEID
ncbi:MAG: U32 family peptidase, partial [Clostridiales bacterium]|nr:U32 family peptidase [Clostridiales bacterium]